METSASDQGFSLSETRLLMPFVVRQQETALRAMPQECVVGFAFLKMYAFVPDWLLQPR